MEVIRKLFEQWSGVSCTEILSLGANGSNRRYWRVIGDGCSCIAAENNDVRENEAFIYYSSALREQGIRVPEVYAVSEDRCHYLQQDLGDITLYSILFDKRRNGGGFDNEMVELYKRVLDDLTEIQLAGRGLDFSKAYPRSDFDAQSIQWDLNYFKYYFLKLKYIPFDEQLLEQDYQTLIQYLLDTDCGYFMYRDFQSRNIMLKDGEFRIMDAVYSATVPQTVKANFGLRDDLWAVIECLMTSNYGAGIAFSVPGFNQADGNGRIYGMKFYKAVTKNIPVMHLNGALFLRAAGNHRGIFWDQRSLLTTGKTNFDDDNESYGILPYIIAGSVYGTNVVGGLYVNGNSISSSSSVRYKENISEKMDDENDPHRLLLLKAKQGRYKKEYGYKLQYADMAGKTVPMFIAEDVAEIYPSAVIHSEDGEVESWDERRIIPGMLQLIQEQKQEIDELKERLARLEHVVEALTNDMR